jgi:hypothetical protein
MPEDIYNVSTLSRHKFSEFIRTHFDTEALAASADVYSKDSLKVALLKKSNDLDKVASQAVSIAIKR